MNAHGAMEERPPKLFRKRSLKKEQKTAPTAGDGVLGVPPEDSAVATPTYAISDPVLPYGAPVP